MATQGSEFTAQTIEFTKNHLSWTLSKSMANIHVHESWRFAARLEIL